MKSMMCSLGNQLFVIAQKHLYVGHAHQQLFETGKKLNVTGFDELKQYITHELGGVMPQEVSNGNLE